MSATITVHKSSILAASLAVAVLCAALLAPSVQAATYTWAGGTNNWDTNTAWNPNIAGGPAAGDSVTFTNTGASRLNINSTTTPSISLVDWNFSQATGDATVLNNTSTGTNTAMSFELTGTLTQGSANNLVIRGHNGGTMSVAVNNIEMTNGRLVFGADYNQDTRFALTAFSVSGTANLSGTSVGTSFQVATAPGVTASFQQVNLGGNIVFRLSAAGGSDVVRDVTMTGLNGTANTRVDANVFATTGNSYTTLTVNSTAGTTSTFDGQLRNGASGNYLNLVKAGTGTQVLGGSNSYTGTTTVSAGSLVLAAGGSVGSSSFLDVASGATLDVSAVSGGFVVGTNQTLQGRGSVVGNATINGALQPGNSPGLLSFSNNLTLGSTAVTTMEIDGAGTRGSDFDAVNVVGLLTYDGALSLSLGTTFGFGSYSFDLFDFGSTSGSFDTVDLVGNYSGSLTNTGGVWGLTSVTGSLTNTWTFTESSGVLGLEVVPEPSTYALLTLAAAGLGAHVLRRRRNKR
jgi:autotransporter-associated beta strand protein